MKTLAPVVTLVAALLLTGCGIFDSDAFVPARAELGSSSEKSATDDSADSDGGDSSAPGAPQNGDAPTTDGDTPTTDGDSTPGPGDDSDVGPSFGDDAPDSSFGDDSSNDRSPSSGPDGTPGDGVDGYFGNGTPDQHAGGSQHDGADPKASTEVEGDLADLGWTCKKVSFNKAVLTAAFDCTKNGETLQVSRFVDPDEIGDYAVNVDARSHCEVTDADTAYWAQGGNWYASYDEPSDTVHEALAALKLEVGYVDC